MKRILILIAFAAMLAYAQDPIAPFDIIKHVEGAGEGGGVTAAEVGDTAQALRNELYPAMVDTAQAYGGAMTGAAIIDSIKKEKAEIDSSWTFLTTHKIHTTSSVTCTTLAVVVDTGAGGGQGVAFSGLEIYGTGINTGSDYPFRIKNSGGGLLFYINGVGRTYIEERLTVDDGIVDYDYLNVYGDVLLGNAPTDTVGVAGKLHVAKNAYNAGTTFTNYVLPTHPDSIPQFGYPGPTYIDTGLIAIMETGMTAPTGYAQWFVDTTGTDSVIVMVGAVRRGFPIE